jgi:hypothetical protein
MTGGVRVIGADRGQPRSDLVDLDSQLPAEHRAWVMLGARRDAGLAGVLRGHQSAWGARRAARDGSEGTAGTVALCDVSRVSDRRGPWPN